MRFRASLRACPVEQREVPVTVADAAAVAGAVPVAVADAAAVAGAVPDAAAVAGAVPVAVADAGLPCMATAREVLSEALQLGERERAALALSLMDSLSPPDHRDEPAWLTEIERRARRVFAGEEQGVEADETIDDVTRDLGL